MQKLRTIKAMDMNKRAFAMELIAFVIIGFIAIAFFALYIYGFNLVDTSLTSGEFDSEGVNMTQASSATFSEVASGMSGPGGLKLMATIMLIGYMIATLFFAYFSSKHPAWIFFYILVTILVVIFSIYISNAYEGLKTTAVIGEAISDFGMAGYIVSKLPIFTTIIGLFGIFLSIVGVYIRRESV